MLAASSKATATALTYPFQAGKTRLQMASKEEEGADAEAAVSEKEQVAERNQSVAQKIWRRILDLIDKSIFGVLIHMLRQEGVRSLYTGLQGELLKSFFSHGLTMFAKGLIYRLFVKLWIKAGPRLRQARLRGKP